MRGDPKDNRALSKLLGVARTKAEDVARTVADLEAGLASAVASLNSLDRAAAHEQSMDLSQLPAAFDAGRYLDGVAARRSAMEATAATLRGEIAAAKDQLGDLFAETKKLEHLIAVTRRAEKRRRSRNELADLDEAARSRAWAGRV
ncbi:MAG: hypothetical protein R3C40_09300 [Parvularculaceae bacterium]